MVEYNENGVANSYEKVFDFSDKICSIKVIRVVDSGVSNYGVNIDIKGKVICGVVFPITKDRVFSLSDLKDFCKKYFERNLSENSFKYIKVIESVTEINKSEFVQLTLF